MAILAIEGLKLLARQNAAEHLIVRPVHDLQALQLCRRKPPDGSDAGGCRSGVVVVAGGRQCLKEPVDNRFTHLR